MPTLKQNPQVGVIIAVVIIVIAAVVFISTRKGSVSSRLGTVYYYDLDSRETFTDKPKVPPIDAPSGGKAVRAHLFACGSCDDPQSHKPGYLETYDTAVQQQLQEGATPEAAGAGHLVSPVPESGPPQRVPYDSPQGMQLRNDPLPDCAQPVECNP